MASLMRTSTAFVPSDPQAIARFIRTYPLAQVVSSSGDDVEATPLPLVAEADADGVIRTFIGHFSRTNRHVDLLRRNGRALCIFLGAQGYVSPSWMRDRTQAPTWNFETAHFLVDVALADQESETAVAIESLLDLVEGETAGRWRSQELGERYPKLLRAVIGFRATVLESRIKFKLGQNERDDVYRDIVSGLQRTGNPRLAEAMEDFNHRCPDLLGATT
jgi:predicted FMN-binding regulatory protein PaiB